MGNRALEHDFFIGGIQYVCIIGLDLLEQWDTVVTVARLTLSTRFGTMELDGPDQPMVSFSPSARACTDADSATERNRRAIDELLKRSCVGLMGKQQREIAPIRTLCSGRLH